MTTPRVLHDTFTLERTYQAPPVRVFAAWADPHARSRWGVPNDRIELRYIASEFRIGGRDVVRCGPVGDLRYGIETRYVDIAPPHRLVMTEVVECAGVRLSASLLTVLMHTEAAATRLRFTAQLASLDGTNLTSGARAGWSAALDNLAREFGRA